MGKEKRMAGDKVSHLAVIMDGNGRWAEKQGLPRLKGHEAGVESIRRLLKLILRYDISYLTLYAFSTENWKRPKLEVNGLMKLLRRFLDERTPELMEQGVRLKVIGRTDDLPASVRNPLFKTIDATAANGNGTLIVALSYGGRAEIVDAAARLMRRAKEGLENPKKLTEARFSEFLYDPSIPDPDLVIRTSGEQRTSNFLSWQTAYSEWFFTETLWPDFGEDDLKKALDSYKKRKRRFGGL